MPKSRTDWKRERRSLQTSTEQSPFPDFEPWDDIGRLLLELGARHSVGNTEGPPPTSRGRALGILEEQARRRRRSRRPGLKGLFGGGE